MFKSFFDFISLLCGIIKGILNIQEEKNAPDVKSAAKANQEIKQEEKEEKDIENKDVEEIRKNLAD